MPFRIDCIALLAIAALTWAPPPYTGQDAAAAQRAEVEEGPVAAPDPLDDDAAATDRDAEPPVVAPDPSPDLPSVVESPRRPPGPVAPKPISGPREMLTLLGVDESHLQQLFDGEPLGDDEQESLWKILYAIRRVELKQIDAWTHRDYDLAEVAALPVAHRCEIYRLRGHVTRVVRRRPIPEVVQRLQMSQYFECRFETEGGREAIVYAHKLPEAWPLDEDIRERAGCDGFFLKLADGDPPRPVFAAQRIAWHPDTLLGNAGMDVGLLAEVPDNTPLGTRDRECFYQLLAAMGNLTQKQLSAEAARQWPTLPPRKQRPDESLVVTLLANSTPYQGHILEFEGSARRAVKVLVGDDDIVARFGIRHYYEIEVFVDLGRAYKRDADSGELSYTYPVVFCVRSLPEGMPEGDAIHQRVRIAGVYLKMWAFKSAFSLEKGAGTRQRSPLLIGREPLWLDAPETGSPAFGVVAAGLFVLALGGIWFGLWQYSRGDKRFRAEAIARQYTPQEGKSLDEIITPPDDDDLTFRG